MITASGAVEYAFEGGALTQSGDPAPRSSRPRWSGARDRKADRDQDGYVDLDELYDYVYDSVREVTPHQTPGKWTFGVQGDLVIARRNSPVTEPATLPADLQHSLDSPLAGVRAGAVSELARLAAGRHQGLALAARKALEDSRRTTAAPSSRVPSSTRGRVAVASAIVLLAAVRLRGVAPGRRRSTVGVDDHPGFLRRRMEGHRWPSQREPLEFTVTLAGLRRGRMTKRFVVLRRPARRRERQHRGRTDPAIHPGKRTTCNPWTVVLEHNERVDDELAMHVDPDPADPYEGDFDVALRRTG